MGIGPKREGRVGMAELVRDPAQEFSCPQGACRAVELEWGAPWAFEIPIRFNITPILERCAQYQLVCPILVLSLRPCLGS